MKAGLRRLASFEGRGGSEIALEISAPKNLNALEKYVVPYSTCSSPQLDQVQESARPQKTIGERFMVKEESAASVGNRPRTVIDRGKKSDFDHCLYALAGYNGMTFTPWVTLPVEKTPAVHRPFHTESPPPPR
ncbi:hypothetical protein AVEN_205924-1 [Araneus ventricosus]|uniref:Uncharacterized protein n=1 Tax=Araneus ventricosus TaxID=182803 RepID=A0A4Y2HH77_ARAVE|nr:hypothetical protein AVEN_205924-1 [Araneus ventricosus]